MKKTQWNPWKIENFQVLPLQLPSETLDSVETAEWRVLPLERFLFLVIKTINHAERMKISAINWNPDRWKGFSLRATPCMYTYIYISMCVYSCCEVIIWAKFGLFRGYYLGQVEVIIWAKVILDYSYSGFKRFLHIKLSSCVFWPVIRQFYNNSVFQNLCRCFLFEFPCFELKFQKTFLTFLKHYKIGVYVFLCSRS